MTDSLQEFGDLAELAGRRNHHRPCDEFADLALTGREEELEKIGSPRVLEFEVEGALDALCPAEPLHFGFRVLRAGASVNQV